MWTHRDRLLWIIVLNDEIIFIFGWSIPLNTVCRQFIRFWNRFIIQWKHLKICYQRYLSSDVLNSRGQMWECVLYTRLTHVAVCTNICLKHRRLIHHCQSVHTALYASCLGWGNVQQICFKSKWEKRELMILNHKILNYGIVS